MAGPGEVRRISSATASITGNSRISDAAGQNDIGHAFDQQADLVVRSGRKRQQRRGAQAIQIDLAVDMRKEIDGHAGAHAFLVAQASKTSSSSARRRLSTAKMISSITWLRSNSGSCARGWTGYRPSSSISAIRARPGIGQKSGETDAVGRGIFELAAEAQGRLAQTDHHDEMRRRRTRAAPRPARGPAFEPEQAQQHPGEGREQRHEGAAQVHARSRYSNRTTEAGAQQTLAERRRAE